MTGHKSLDEQRAKASSDEEEAPRGAQFGMGGTAYFATGGGGPRGMITDRDIVVRAHIQEPVPHPPGVFLRDCLLPARGIKEQELLEKSGLPPERLEALFAGTVRIDQEVRDALAPTLGESAADGLCRYQRNYDYFKRYRTLPPASIHKPL